MNEKSKRVKIPKTSPIQMPRDLYWFLLAFTEDKRWSLAESGREAFRAIRDNPEKIGQFKTDELKPYEWPEVNFINDPGLFEWVKTTSESTGSTISSLFRDGVSALQELNSQVDEIKICEVQETGKERLRYLPTNKS